MVLFFRELINRFKHLRVWIFAGEIFTIDPKSNRTKFLRAMFGSLLVQFLKNSNGVFLIIAV